MREIYVASLSLRYGGANLTKIQVKKETPKTFTIELGGERILGAEYFGRQISKETHHCFATPEEAMEYLVEAAKGHIQSCRAKVAKALTEHQKLVKLLESVKKGGECDPDH